MILATPRERPDVCCLPATFTAVVVHDGLLAGFRAKEALRWLNHVLGPQSNVRFFSWSFDQLDRADMRAKALKAAALAQMIIVAGGEDAPVPPHVEGWLNACASDARARGAVIVALPDDESLCQFGGHEPRFVHTIRRLAARWHADFMSGAEFDQRAAPDLVKQRFLPASAALPLQRYTSPWLEA
ncbi:MAG: hypothetical protein B7Z47_01320 [Chthoniobacter sp. 12-60-6]|nr:MAG: hypothetical protein B7Z47_01320 [Chthoniobacter sp. 12-60-6]